MSQTPFCSYCKSIGKSVGEYTTHFAHKTLNKNSRFTCPELLARVCNDCPNYNHTYDRCPKRHIKQAATKPVQQSVAKTVAKTKFDCLYDSDDDESEETTFGESEATTFGESEATTFGESEATTFGESEATTFGESDAIDKSVTETEVCVESAPNTEANSIFFVDYKTEEFRNQSIEDQKDQLGEYIYRIIATTHPEKAGAYTGCLLDLEVDHLIYIIETPSEMNEMLIRLVESNI
jgi:hypothetical protein